MLEPCFSTGYYDQTDIFFKMAKVLSINTSALDQAVAAKRNIDVPYPVVLPQLLTDRSGGKVTMLKNAQLVSPRLMKEGETYCQDERHDH